MTDSSFDAVVIGSGNYAAASGRKEAQRLLASDAKLVQDSK